MLATMRTREWVLVFDLLNQSSHAEHKPDKKNVGGWGNAIGVEMPC
jgi:hypothetical protein